MGFIDRVKQLLGGTPPLSPEVERAVDEQLREFVRKEFAERYIRFRREHGFSEEDARRNMLETLGMHLGDRKLTKAAINYIAAAARLRLELDCTEEEEEALGKALKTGAKSRFNERDLIELTVKEVAALERGPQQPAGTTSPQAANEWKESVPIGTISVQGAEFPLALDVEALCRAIDEGGRGVLRFETLGYGQILVDVMAAVGRRYGDRSPQASAVVPASLLCAGCQLEFPGSFRLALQGPDMFGGAIVMGGAPGREAFAKTGACPQCGTKESLLVYEYVAEEAITAADVEAIRDYWRGLGAAWWSAETRASAICDWCNGDVARGSGYLSGSSLLCDECVAKGLMTEGLTKLKANPDYYGAGLIRKARAARGTGHARA